MLLTAVAPLRGAEYFVTVDGLPRGVGSQVSPLDIATALGTSSPARGGDTIWIRGGKYVGTFTVRLRGEPGVPITVRNYDSERVILDGSIRLSSTIHTRFWGLEIIDSNKATDANGELWVTVDGTENDGVGFVNCVIHDCRNAFGGGPYFMYGCLIYHFGKNSREHALYWSNHGEKLKTIRHNLIFNGSGYGLHLYGSDSRHFLVEGNTLWNQGALAFGLTGTLNAELLLGGGGVARNVTITNNCFYQSRAYHGGTGLTLGYGSLTNYDLRVVNNYIAANTPVLFQNFFTRVTLTNNYIHSTDNRQLQNHRPHPFRFGPYDINRNFYSVESTTDRFENGSGHYITLAGWQNETGFDRNSTVRTSATPPDAVFITVNEYERGRGHVTIYNWSLRPSVTVDISSIVPLGRGYEVRYAENFFGTPVLSGVYSGGSIQIPMQNLRTAEPLGGYHSVAPSAPEFGVFVITPISDPNSTPPVVSGIADQTINEDTVSADIPFRVSDRETPANALTVYVNSSNSSLIPVDHITLTGTDTNRTIRFSPLTNRFGSSQITLTVTDGSQKTNTTFLLNVRPVNDPPSFSPSISNQTIPQDGSSGLISFFVGDVEVNPGDLSVVAISSNPALLPGSALALTGTDYSRILRITPTRGMSGIATVSVIVSDESTNTTKTFTVTVTPPSTLRGVPTITDIPDQVSLNGVAIPNLPFTLADPDTTPASLTLTAASSNPTVVPTQSVAFGGSGANRTVSVTPAAGQVGSSVITITVSDGVNRTTESFVVTVKSNNQAPSISNLADSVVQVNTVAGPYAFTVGDAETPAANLLVSARSYSQSLIYASNVVVTGTGASRTLTVKPETNLFGSAVIVLAVTDGVNTNKSSFMLTVAQPNELPTFTVLTDLTFREDTTNNDNVVYFTVADKETPVSDLVVSATSTDTNLVPVENIFAGGSGSNRFVRVTPVENGNGDVDIRVGVSDGRGTRYGTIHVHVLPVVDGPSIESLAEVTIYRNSTNIFVPLGLTDPDIPETSLGTLVLRAWSSNQTLVPNANLITTNGGSTGVFISPAADQTGTATLFVSASDGSTTSTQSFSLSVIISNTPPVVDAGTNTTVFSALSYMLRGRVTDDGLPAVPGRVSSSWSVVSGPGTVAFGTPGYTITSARFSVAGFYRLRLTATDGELTTSDDVFILVKVNTDMTAPVLTDLTVSNITDRTITLSWTTDEPADGQVEFGTTPLYGKNTLLALEKTTRHAITVTNLTPGIRYYLRAKTRDASGNKTLSRQVSVSTLRSAKVYLPLLGSAATLAGPMVLTNDTALNETYLTTTVDQQGSASWTFYAPVQAPYFIWSRIYCPTVGRDSFLVSMDGGSVDVFDCAENKWSAEWQWTILNGRAGGGAMTLNPRLFTLAPGEHTLSFGGRESRTFVSRVLVTNDPDFVPTDDAPIGGVTTAAACSDPVLVLTAPVGWSTIGNPLQPLDNRISMVIPSPLGSLTYQRFNPSVGDFTESSFTTDSWSAPEVTLGLGEGGLLYNPASSPVPIVLTGPLANPAQALSLQAGLNLISLKLPLSGKLTTLLNFAFQANDKVMVVRPESGDYETYTFDGSRWDVEPVLSLGESLFLDLIPR